MSNIEVRDRREKGFFTVDNEILDSYESLGPFAVLAYAVLCRHANNGSQSCTLLLETIAKKARISKASAHRGIKELESAELLTVEKRYKESSLFTLLRVTKIAFPIETKEVSAFLLAPTSPDSAFLSDAHNNTKIFNNTKTLPSVKEGRHKRVRDFIQKKYQQKFNIPCPWNGSDGKALNESLALYDDPTIERLLRNYFLSEIKGDRPRFILSNIGRYSDGPVKFSQRGQKPTLDPQYPDLAEGRE